MAALVPALTACLDLRPIELVVEDPPYCLSLDASTQAPPLGFGPTPVYFADGCSPVSFQVGDIRLPNADGAALQARFHIVNEGGRTYFLDTIALEAEADKPDTFRVPCAELGPVPADGSTCVFLDSLLDFDPALLRDRTLHLQLRITERSFLDARGTEVVEGECPPEQVIWPIEILEDVACAP